MDGLESLSGDYSFSDPHSPSDPLLHPQKAISWIEQHAGPSDEDGSFQLLSYLLNLLPQYSDVSGVPSVDDLIDVVATGAVDVDITADSFVDDDLSLPTWNALYYAGALTRDPRRPETLRLCNGAAALAIIHDTLDKFMPDRYDRRTVFLTAWSRFCDHRPNSLLKILEGIFHDQTARAFGKSHEPNLHGIFELLLRSKETVPNRSLRARPFIVSPSQIATHPVICEIPSRGPTDTISVELLTITLVGLWRGENPNEDGRRPTKDELETLFNAVSGEEEAVLLARQYRVWSETLNAMETVVVGSLMRSGSELIQLVAIGGARVLYRGPPPPTPEPTHGCQSCGCTCGNSKSDPEDDCYNYKSY
ncbi:hypothetical protein C8F01DRAFT_1128260 [Mycena amicta]|nr:hypothetical protein C8F01DRAFT_1128260 [Mycena amicta]